MVWTTTDTFDAELLRQQVARLDAEQAVAARDLDSLVATESARPGFMQRMRTTVAPYALAVGGFLTAFGVAAPAPAADVVNLGAARVAGEAGSDWHDRQLVKDKGGGSSFSVFVTPRGQEYSADDPSLSLVLQPGETRIIEDLYAQLFAEAGAGTIRLVADEGSTLPLWRSVVFNQNGEEEYGMTSRPFSEEHDGYFSATTLGTILSPAGFRDNIDTITNSQGMLGTWTYKNSAGGNEQSFEKWYAPNTTQQFSARNLLGFEPEPGSSLEFTITQGSGRLFLARNHNISNDPSRDEFEEMTQPVTPKILGLDYDGDGVPDNIDADGDGVLDDVMEYTCSMVGPIMHLISEHATGDYTGESIPNGMQVFPEGMVTYVPDCADANTTQRATFAHDGATISADYKVNEFIEPRIVGLDLDGDGIADVLDADGDHMLDSVIDLSCGFPIDYEHQIITENVSGPINYFGDNLPQWVNVNSGTGLMIVNPPCSDSGQNFTPAIFVTGMTTSTTIRYRVGD